jgi:hypothetical protein
VNPKECLGVPGGGGGTSFGIRGELMPGTLERVPGTVVPVPGMVLPVRGIVVGVPPVPLVEEVVVVPPVREVVVVLEALAVVVVVAGGGVPPAQFGRLIVSVSSVTAPFLASTRPRIVTRFVTVMLV